MLLCQGGELSAKVVRTRGHWSAEERQLYINRLEMLAAFFALQCSASDLHDCEVLLRVDNTTAIAYINKMGKVRFMSLSDLSRQIWSWCEKRKLWVFASYIKSSDNANADRESRWSYIGTEWGLATYAYKKVIKALGVPEIDLFASRIDKECPRYFSWKADPEAVNVDAFTANWREVGFFWAFPPFSLVTRVLRKIITDKGQGIVVVPNLPSQPWFPSFKSLIIGDPIYLSPDANLLESPCISMCHPLASSLELIAAKLSWIHSD